MCIAGNLNEERKGGSILRDILESDAKDYCQFMLIGEGNKFNDPKIRNLGYVKDELTLRIAYNAADILLHPAQVDNLPNTVAESMSCGTPVLAFNTGGLPENGDPTKEWLVGCKYEVKLDNQGIEFSAKNQNQIMNSGNPRRKLLKVCSVNKRWQLIILKLLTTH